MPPFERLARRDTLRADHDVLGGRVDPGFDNGVDLAGDLVFALFQLATLVADAASELSAFVVICLDVFDEVSRLCQFTLHAGECQMLDIIAFHATAIRTLATLAKRRALDTIRAVPILDGGTFLRDRWIESSALLKLRSHAEVTRPS
jgi:hypothetical protein